MVMRSHTPTSEEIGAKLDRWVEAHIHCSNCIHVQYDLFGPYCVALERYLGVDTSMCEEHNLTNPVLAEQLEKLQAEWLDAWGRENPEFANWLEE